MSGAPWQRSERWKLGDLGRLGPTGIGTPVLSLGSEIRARVLNSEDALNGSSRCRFACPPVTMMNRHLPRLRARLGHGAPVPAHLLVESATFAT